MLTSLCYHTRWSDFFNGGDLALAKQSTLKFEVSTGLKDVLGSRLITDDEVAVFGLVKNCFDAGATRVDLYFDQDSFVISDNGKGMSLDDIRSKWLFVAYSSKRVGKRTKDYRSQISSKREIAGSKGIGRFSSDRLGRQVVLQSRPKGTSESSIHELSVDWNKFDVNQLHKFTDIELDYRTVNDFTIPDGFKTHKYGTVISITELRNDWGRDKLLKLKSSLTKLINPLASKSENFKIILRAPEQEDEDSNGKAPHEIVNGKAGHQRSCQPCLSDYANDDDNLLKRLALNGVFGAARPASQSGTGHLDLTDYVAV